MSTVTLLLATGAFYDAARRTAVEPPHLMWGRTLQAHLTTSDGKAIPDPKLVWWDGHHLIVATMLYHALAQGDL